MFNNIKNFLSIHKEELISIGLTIGLAVGVAMIFIGISGVTEILVNRNRLYTVRLLDKRDGSIIKIIVNKNQLAQLEAAQAAFDQKNATEM